MKLLVDESGNRTIIQTVSRLSLWYRPRVRTWWVLTLKPKLIPDILTRDFRGRAWPIIQTITFDDPRESPQITGIVFDEYDYIERQRGGALFSALLALVCVMIIGAILLPAITMYREGRLEVVDGKLVRHWCIRGYRFVSVGDDPARQVFDAAGHGVPCEE